jgi:hypothetical protein
MIKQLKLAAYEMMTNPQARTLLILGTVVVATLVAGAPNDFGGVGGK